MTAFVRRFGTLGLLVPLVLVSIEVLINDKTWLISGPDHLYLLRGLNTHPLPYIDSRIEYPVLTGIFMTIPAALAHGVRTFLRLNTLGLWACALGCTYVLWSIDRRTAWRFALCPLLLVFSVINWDLFAILLMLLGWRAFVRGRYAAAGAWLALGVFAKLFPIFLLAFCVVELARRRRARATPTARRDALRFLVSALVTSAVVNAPFMALAFHNWSYFWSFNASRNDRSGLLCWLRILSHASVGTTNAVLTAIVLVAAAIGAVAVWRGMGVAHVAASVFFVFMLLEKVYSPQYTLWLVVFALLAGWELWTIAVLSVVGLVDYANAAIHIYLVGHHSTMLQWYDHHIYTANQGLRLMTMLVVAASMTYQRARGLSASEIGWVRGDPREQHGRDRSADRGRLQSGGRSVGRG